MRETPIQITEINIPPTNLVEFVAEQLGAEAAEITAYAKRDQTRREHLQLLCREYRFRQYGAAYSASLRRNLEIEALSTDAAFTLVEYAIEWLRERKVILPVLSTLETLVRSVRSKGEGFCCSFV